MKKVIAGSIFMALVSLLPGRLMAAGFQNPPAGAAAAGQGGAFVAQADDATAITHNPAGLMQRTGTDLLFTTSIINPGVKYTSLSGQTENAKTDIQYLPALYFATDLGKTDWRFGLGVTTPYGQSSEWSEEGAFRNYATFSQLVVVNVNPTAAHRVNRQLSVGGGVDWYSVQLKQYAFQQIGPFTNITQDLSVDGDAWGYNLGLLYQPAAKHSIGAAFRSEAVVRPEGDVVIRNLPAPPFALKSDVSTKITLPASFALGYAYRPTPRWKIEADLEWLQWSSTKDQPVSFASAALAPQTIPKRWHDTWSPRLGVEARINDAWKVWGGYVFLPTPIPDATLDSALPDSDADVFCLGVGWEHRKWTVSFSQEFSFPRDRTITSTEVPNFSGVGTYQAMNYVSTLNVQYAF